MTLENYCKAWPGSKVFVNDYSLPGFKPNFWANPIQFIYDGMMDIIFSSSIVYQKTNEKPVFPTLKTKDNRLPNKENVYVVPLEGENVAYTKAFLQEKKIINTTIGGRKVVMAYFPEFDAIGAFHNDTGKAVKSLDFYGRLSDGKKLQRVETLKAGCFWCVWINWFPQTDLNRAWHASQRAWCDLYMNCHGLPSYLLQDATGASSCTMNSRHLCRCVVPWTWFKLFRTLGAQERTRSTKKVEDSKLVKLLEISPLNRFSPLLQRLSRADSHWVYLDQFQ